MSAEQPGPRFAAAVYSRAVRPEEGRAAGYAGGYAAGYAAGAREAARVAEAAAAETLVREAEQRAQYTAEQQSALAVLARAAAAAAARTTPVLAEAELALHAAGLELATAVLGCELADAEHSARAALARVREHPQAVGVHVVRLHPRDLAALAAVGLDPTATIGAGTSSDSASGADADGTAAAGVRLVADSSLDPGDAIGEHPDGYLDATIAGALDRARTALAVLDQEGA